MYRKDQNSTGHSANHGLKQNNIVILGEEDKLQYSEARVRCHSFYIFICFFFLIKFLT